MKRDKVNLQSLFGAFICWAKSNNWISEENNEFFLTEEGSDEMSALGLDIKEVLNGKEIEADDIDPESIKKEIDKIHLYTDGGSRGNQFVEGGKAAIGMLLCNECDEVIMKHKQYLGKATNNQAEYTALITGLNLVKNFHSKYVVCFSDSQLMINQLNGLYRIKDTKLQKLVMKVKELERDFKSVKYIHLPRENKMLKKADKMVNKVLDVQGV